MAAFYLFLVLVIQVVTAQEEADFSILPTSAPAASSATFPELTTVQETNETSSNASSTEESVAPSEAEALGPESEAENANSTAAHSISTEDTIGVETRLYVTEDEGLQNQTLPSAKPTGDSTNGASPLAQSGLFAIPMCFQLLTSRFLWRL